MFYVLSCAVLLIFVLFSCFSLVLVCVLFLYVYRTLPSTTLGKAHGSSSKTRSTISQVRSHGSEIFLTGSFDITFSKY